MQNMCIVISILSYVHYVYMCIYVHVGVYMCVCITFLYKNVIIFADYSKLVRITHILHSMWNKLYNCLPFITENSNLAQDL